MTTTRVLILGAGPAGLTTAWELSRHRALSVQILQAGAVAGGKCGTRRGVGGRVEQNGTHYAFGCYRNFLALLGEVYADPGIQARYGDLAEHLRPRDRFVARQRWRNRWVDWELPVDLLGPWLRRLPRPGSSNTAARAAKAGRRAAWAAAAVAPDSLAAHRAALGVDLGATLLVGLVADGLLDGQPDAWGPLDDEDWRAWLLRHGARRETAWSCLTRLFYDAVAAYAAGDTARPALSASAGLVAVLSACLDREGAFAFQFRRGIGDSVIAPWYEALVQRGVSFRWFHRVRRLVPSPDHRSIDAVEVEVQARSAQGYDPLVSVAGRPAWRGRPDQAQLEEAPPTERPDCFYAPDTGARLRLLRGRDYDQLVYAMPLQAAPFVAPELVGRRDKPWARAVGADPGVATQSLRLHLAEPREALWGPGPAPVVGAGAPAFATWEDSEDLIQEEAWPAGGPAAIASLFGPMATPVEPGVAPHWRDARAQQARAAAERFMSKDAPDLWPGLASAGGVSEALFRSPDLDRSAGLQVTANVGPLERYSQALPGGSRHRMAPDGSGYEGLWLAGDWTWTPMRLACIESAVFSGRQAADHVRQSIGLAPRPPHLWLVPPGRPQGELQPRGVGAWQPVLAGAALGSRPVRVQHDGGALVLFRSRDGRPVALGDACPHRGMSLSRGKVVNGELVCPYHGWRWSRTGTGRCPAQAGAGLRQRPWATEEAHGLIWVGGAADRPLPVDPGGLRPLGAFTLEVAAPLAAVLDNLSEAEHVPHAHWMGYDDAAHVTVSTVVDREGVHVENLGPPGRATRLVGRLLGARGDYRIAWRTQPDPLRITFEHSWTEAGPVLRAQAWLAALGPRRTRIVLAAWTNRTARSGRVLDRAQLAWLRVELLRDAALLAHVTPTGVAPINRFDRGVAAARTVARSTP